MIQTRQSVQHVHNVNCGKGFERNEKKGKSKGSKRFGWRKKQVKENLEENLPMTVAFL